MLDGQVDDADPDSEEKVHHSNLSSTSKPRHDLLVQVAPLVVDLDDEPIIQANPAVIESCNSIRMLKSFVFRCHLRC